MKESATCNNSQKEKVPGVLCLISIATIPLVMTLGNSMLIPILPTLEKELSISSFQSSLIITLYSVAAIILIPVAGYLSDRFGRKKIIIPSLIISLLGGLVSGYAAWQINEPYMMILIGRILQGIGAAGASPIVLPLVGDLYKDEKEVSANLGIVETANTLGKVVSPILGSLLALVVWFMPFFAIPVLCLISVVFLFFCVKVPKQQDKPLPLNEFLKKVKRIFKEEGHWLYSIFIAGIILMFILFGFLFYLANRLEKEFGMVGVDKGLVLAIPLAALCLASFITGKVIKQNKLLMKWITVIGLLLTAASLFIASFFSSFVVLIGLLVLTGIGIGSSLPSLDALITEGIDKGERGTITSIYSSMRFVGVALGPPIFAILTTHMDKGLFYINVVLSLIGGILVWWRIQPDKE
ncbi:MFS transporter [Priestia endophytica]|uniref:MFS transporter n=1 Tax=Priestia endophytica TaxID=135735 RepID=UPI000DCA6A0E|nr:MFS transporter [Priestia endophytica]RAS86853.1 MFS transporter [Priestia endophytica]